MNIVVFGAGSLGSLVGGVLARTHDVTLVGRNPHMATVSADGLEVVGALEATTRPAATTDGTNLEGDLAVVTVKAFDTAAAARALATGEFDGVLSLQNGLGNEETLARHLQCPVLAGAATYGARLREPGVVECTGIGDVVLGPADGGHSDLADRAGDAFRQAGFETEIAADMPRRRWVKLAVNAGINGPTALARVPNGQVLAGDLRPTARAAARETATVARAEGVDLAEEEAVQTMESVADSTAVNTSSTLQDVEAGRRTEVDVLNGAVADYGTRHGIPTPINRTLAGLLRAWERQHGLRPEE